MVQEVRQAGLSSTGIEAIDNDFQEDQKIEA